jgi:hypothetical protein
MRPMRDPQTRRICATLKPNRAGAERSHHHRRYGVAQIFFQTVFTSNRPPHRRDFASPNQTHSKPTRAVADGTASKLAGYTKMPLGAGVLLCSTWNIHRAASPRAALQPLALPTSRRALTLPAP